MVLNFNLFKILSIYNFKTTEKNVCKSNPNGMLITFNNYNPGIHYI